MEPRRLLDSQLSSDRLIECRSFRQMRYVRYTKVVCRMCGPRHEDLSEAAEPMSDATSLDDVNAADWPTSDLPPRNQPPVFARHYSGHTNMHTASARVYSGTFRHRGSVWPIFDTGVVGRLSKGKAGRDALLVVYSV